MKKFFLMLPASIALTVTAQSNTTSATNLAAGTVVYERVVKLDRTFQRTGRRTHNEYAHAINRAL